MLGRPLLTPHRALALGWPFTVVPVEVSGSPRLQSWDVSCPQEGENP